MKPKPSASAMLFEEFLEKGRRFCAFRERSIQETIRRLHQLGASQETGNRIIKILENEGFLNNERFARALVRGKFRNNHWGRVRILQQLSYHQIPEQIIHLALTEINEKEYYKMLRSLVQKKFNSLKGQTLFKAKGKTAQFCIGKGFEPELVWQMVNEL